MRNILEKYLISIETEKSHRLQAFFAQNVFKQNTLFFHIFGVKGADLPTTQYFKLAVANRERPLSPAELGCTLSHVQAIEHFLETDQQYAVFFFFFSIQKYDFSLEQLEQEMLKLNLAPSFLLSLGGIQLSFSEKVKGTLIENKLFGKNVLAIHPYYYKNLSSTYAYILDRDMAKILVEYHQPPHGCDHWGDLSALDNVPHLYATYLFDHPEIISDQSNSYIEQERVKVKGIKQNKAQLSLYVQLINKLARLRLQKYHD